MWAGKPNAFFVGILADGRPFRGNSEGGQELLPPYIRSSLCFVASAAYGSPDHPMVLALREFRDNVLARSPAGRAFTGWYYRNGPALAAVIKNRPMLRTAARIMLMPMVWNS